MSITAMKQALEALEEACEIVGPAWAWRDEKGRPAITTIKAALEAKDEPVAWEQFHEHMAGPNYVAPQRTWVGLTKEEINQGLLRSFYVLEKARAWRDGVAWAEEILKEKNNAV